MSGFCNYVHAECCVELANICRTSRCAALKLPKILQILFSDVARSLALTAALCIKAAVTVVTISNCNKFSSYMQHSVMKQKKWWTRFIVM